MPSGSGVSEAPGRPREAWSFSATFGAMAQWVARQCGRSNTFALACLLILVWAATGPYFHYSDTWQLVVNTGTSLVTFLMVFLIQNTQNRDMAVLQLKLGELIRASENARNGLLNLEDLTEKELERLKATFTNLAGGGPDRTLLHEAADGLQSAADELASAKQKVGAAAGGQGRQQA